MSHSRLLAWLTDRFLASDPSTRYSRLLRECFSHIPKGRIPIDGEPTFQRRHWSSLYDSASARQFALLIPKSVTKPYLTILIIDSTAGPMATKHGSSPAKWGSPRMPTPFGRDRKQARLFKDAYTLRAGAQAADRTRSTQGFLGPATSFVELDLAIGMFDPMLRGTPILTSSLRFPRYSGHPNYTRSTSPVKGTHHQYLLDLVATTKCPLAAGTTNLYTSSTSFDSPQCVHTLEFFLV